MSKSKTKKKGRVMWGFIYVVVFLTAFLASVVMKMTADPFHGKYTVKWDESVGTVYADLSYGEGAANKFDLYVPADSSRDSYGLAVYLHAGGFTTGDKQDDQAMLQWLCSKGYVAAGINYTLRDEAHPEASVYSQSVEIRDSIPHVIAEAEKLGISPHFRFQITADCDLYCIQELSCCEADSARLQINSFLTIVNRCEGLMAEHINFAKGYL